MHLWAKKHDLLETQPSNYDKLLMKQGMEIESLAIQFLQEFLQDRYQSPEIFTQKTFTDQSFEGRVDVAIMDGIAQTCDLFEIKSSTSVKKEHLYDATFQRLVCSASINVGRVFLVYVNKEYVHGDELDLQQFFVIEDISDRVDSLIPDVKIERLSALEIAMATSADLSWACNKPKSCICPGLCHPGLPDFSIYDIPRLHKNKISDLKSMGILSISEIPADFPLTDTQRKHVQIMKSQAEHIELDRIRKEMGRLEYPLHFLDYETYNPGVPYFNGYQPYQHIVFQYSLHKIEHPEAESQHSDFLSLDPLDPAREVIEHLLLDLDLAGSIIVWNESFEASRNKELAGLYTQFADRLLGMNARMFDLMKIFSQGYYIHPQFRGSYSIKNVLPVLVPDLEKGYGDLPIPQGDEAMLAWLELMTGEINSEGKAEKISQLLEYCELDTLAMVEIWRVLSSLIYK